MEATTRDARAYVHVLRLTDTDQLARAFDHLVTDERVEDCLVESAMLRIRFVAAPGRAAELVEKIYREGGLVWCQRFPLPDLRAYTASK